MYRGDHMFMCRYNTYVCVCAYMKRQCSRREHWAVMTPNVAFLKELHPSVSMSVASVFSPYQNQLWSILKFYIQSFYISKNYNVDRKRPRVRTCVKVTVMGLYEIICIPVGCFGWLDGWFCSSVWYKLELSKKDDSQLRICLPQISLVQASLWGLSLVDNLRERAQPATVSAAAGRVTVVSTGKQAEDGKWYSRPRRLLCFHLVLYLKQSSLWKEEGRERSLFLTPLWFSQPS